jgi:nitrate/nitrite-specific signal transduction histidine kinase
MKPRLITLRVTDDGVGIETNPGGGVGLQIMRYRASSIGAMLSIERREQGGTAVTCQVVSRHPGPERPRLQ